MGIPIDQTLLGLMGIAVSVVLFIIGYRQTIGAKNERIAAANKEIERILIRRIVLESYLPTRDDVSRLLAGKARDFRVGEDDLASESELYTAIFTRIFESDLIPSAQRDEILTRIAPAISEAEREMLRDAETEGARQPQARTQSLMPLLWFALAATALGVIVVTLLQPDWLTAGLGALLVPSLVTFAGSLIAIWIFILVIRFRSVQEGGRRENLFEQLTILEKQVKRILSHSGRVQEQGRSRRGFGYDFILSRGGRNILVQVKLWRRNMPNSFVRQVIKQVERAARDLDAAEVIIVTTEPVEVDDKQASANVKFMTIGELSGYLEQSAA